MSVERAAEGRCLVSWGAAGGAQHRRGIISLAVAFKLRSTPSPTVDLRHGSPCMTWFEEVLFCGVEEEA